MFSLNWAKQRQAVLGFLGALMLAGTGCTPEWIAAGTVIGIAGTTVVGGAAPTDEIQQTYYIGSFDPQDQVPPQIYRIRFHGQAAALSNTRFASGWVPAHLVDSLNTQIGVEAQRGGSKIPTFTEGDASKQVGILSTRRLVQFGPEGFMESPRDHRLVIVMGANPQAFFAAIDEILGKTAGLEVTQANAEVRRRMLDAMLTLESQRSKTELLKNNVKHTLEGE